MVNKMSGGARKNIGGGGIDDKTTNTAPPLKNYEANL